MRCSPKSASAQALAHARDGFTLVELLVVMAIIGVMVAMTIPAVQASREAARRNICQSHAAQWMLAMQSYENAFEVFPAGVRNPQGPIRSEPRGMHQGWLIALLPYVDEEPLYRAIDLTKSVYDPANQNARDVWPQLMVCPSSYDEVRGASSYAGCHHDVEAPIDADNHGLLFLNSQIHRDQITDGTAYTIAIGEKLSDPSDLGWMSGTRATLRNTNLPLNTLSEPVDPQQMPLFVGGFASPHVMGAHVGFGDGSVRFIADDIALDLWRQLGNRADGKLIKGSLHGR